MNMREIFFYSLLHSALVAGAVYCIFRIDNTMSAQTQLKS